MQLSRFLTCSFRVETEFYYYTLLHYVQGAKNLLHLVTPTKLRIEAKPRDYTYNDDDGDYDFVKGRAMVT